VNGMADKQYKRKTSDDLARYAREDPLSELARIVGYDPRGRDSGPSSHREPELDLEAELLRELEGSSEYESDPAQAAYGRVQPVEPDFVDAPEASRASSPVSAAQGADEDFDDALSLDIGASLEEELLRGFEDEQNPDVAEPSLAWAPETDAAFNADSHVEPAVERPMSSASFDEADEAIADLAPSDGEQFQSDLPSESETADAGQGEEPVGFIFPSFDQLEQDETFDAGGWAHEDRSLDEPTGGRYGNEPATIEAEEFVAYEADTATPSDSWNEKADAASEPDAIAALPFDEPDEHQTAVVESDLDFDPHADFGEVTDEEDGAFERPEASAPPTESEFPSSAVASAEQDEQPIVASETAWADVEEPPATDGENVDAHAASDDRAESELDVWLRSAVEDVERSRKPASSDVIPAGNIVQLYGGAPRPSRSAPSSRISEHQDGSEGSEEASRSLATKAQQIIQSDRSGSRPEGSAASGMSDGRPAFDERQKESTTASAAGTADSPSSEEEAELPFDPAAIAEYDEAVEPTFELDIPRLPGDGEEPVAAVAVDDFDLDSDLADLLASPEDDPVAGAAAAAPAFEPTEVPILAEASAQLGSTASVSASGRFEDIRAASIDFDELERAIDEDLGAAYAENPQAARPNPAEVIVGGAVRRPAGGMTWQSLGAGVAALLVIGAVVVVGWNYMGGSSGGGSDGSPRIITADKGPIKEKPANPGGKSVPNQNKIVYDKVDGSETDTPQQKSLVTTTEAPMDVVQRTLQTNLPNDPSAASGEPDGIVPAGNGGQPAQGASSAGYDKSEARLTPSIQAASPASVAPAGLVPHYVQTMTVTPDGKLVPTSKPEDNTAAASNAPTPQQPVGGDQANSAPTTQAPAAAPPAQVRQNLANAFPVARPAAPAPQPAAAAPAAAKPVQAAAVAQPVAQPSAPQPSAAPKPGDYLIQIASQPTEAGAKASYQNLSRRYASVIGGKAYDIQKASVAGKGVYYRVRIAAGSRQDAISLCESYRSSGGSCFVTH